MTEDQKDFLDDFVDDPVETPDAEAQEPASGTPRGPDGKFLKAEADREAQKAEKGEKEPASETEADSTEPPSDGEEGTMVPVSVVKKLREELKAAKAARTTESQNQPAAPDFGQPGPNIEEQLLNMRLQTSAQIAGMAHGQDVVAQAWAAFDEACEREPLTGQASIMSKALREHPHPLDEIVKWHKRQQELSAIESAGGLEAYVEAQLAARQGVPQGQQPARNGNAKPNTPPSLAGRSGGSSAKVSGDPFDELFNS